MSRAHQWLSRYQDFFLISTQQSYQPIKLVELVDDLETFDGVCRGRVELINGSVFFFFFLISTQSITLRYQIGMQMTMFLRGPCQAGVTVQAVVTLMMLLQRKKQWMKWVAARNLTWIHTAHRMELEDDALSILASAKLRVYRHFVQVGLGIAVEDPLIAWSRTLQLRGFLLPSSSITL
ncbi:hypothetical protein LAZ67_7003165 [Cordylochernes scorpioides]|uniref:Uncharacterized protein n=1 Tax=Cordylochernes scorpioides TaxID=51811 RepID=A0ABY6KP49_9ARAC|nr:hypothetical protein LAZ67_7003165 [Cordylochernes scorpioides]